MSSQGDCDRERDSRRSSGSPRGATSATVDSTHDIQPRNTEDFSLSLGLAAFPLDCDVRTSIGATAVSNTTATAPSSPVYLQAQHRAMIRAHFPSHTPPAGSTEHQAERSNIATRTLASEETTEQLVPLWERHPSCLSLSLAAGIGHAEPSTIKKECSTQPLIDP